MRTSLAHRAWCAELMTKSPSLKVVNVHLKCPPPHIRLTVCDRLPYTL